MLDNGLKAQLKGYLQKLVIPVELVASLDDGPNSRELLELLTDIEGESDKVSLLKIDVEGAEFAVLRGARRILRQHAPLLVFECENAPGSVTDVFSYLESFGYEGRFVRQNRLYPISQFDAALHQRQDGEWFWKRKDYCNNFVFAKRRAP